MNGKLKHGIYYETKIEHGSISNQNKKKIRKDIPVCDRHIVTHCKTHIV